MRKFIEPRDVLLQLLQGQLLPDHVHQARHQEARESGDVVLNQKRPRDAGNIEGDDLTPEDEDDGNEVQSHLEIRDARGQTVGCQGVHLSQPFQGVRVARDAPRSSFQETWMEEDSEEDEPIGQAYVDPTNVEQGTDEQGHSRVQRNATHARAQDRAGRGTHSERARGIESQSLSSQDSQSQNTVRHQRRRSPPHEHSLSEQEWKEEREWLGRVRSGRCRLCGKWAQKCACRPPRAVSQRQIVGVAAAHVHVAVGALDSRHFTRAQAVRREHERSSDLDAPLSQQAWPSHMQELSSELAAPSTSSLALPPQPAPLTLCVTCNREPWRVAVRAIETHVLWASVANRCTVCPLTLHVARDDGDSRTIGGGGSSASSDVGL